MTMEEEVIASGSSAYLCVEEDGSDCGAWVCVLRIQYNTHTKHGGVKIE
jgi:hypothetical protein